MIGFELLPEQFEHALVSKLFEAGSAVAKEERAGARLEPPSVRGYAQQWVSSCRVCAGLSVSAESSPTCCLSVCEWSVSVGRLVP